MSPTVYKILHVFGFLMVFMALGGITLQTLVGGGDRRVRKLTAIAHGLGLVIVLVSGFGLMAKLDYNYSGLWFYLKVGIWVLAGAMIALIRRMPRQATLFWWGLPVLGALAAFLALYKPGI